MIRVLLFSLFAPLALFTLLILIYMWSITQRSSQYNFKVFNKTTLGWIRTLDLPDSKRTLYHYTIESKYYE